MSPTKKSNKFKNMVFPLVRKIFPTLLSQQIVSVQPMTMPSGILTYIDGIFSMRRPCTSQAELNRLFEICWKFDEMFPPGTVVTLDTPRILATDNAGTTQIMVKSEPYVLSKISTVGFLCDKSGDDSDFYYVDDLVEYKQILKDLGYEPK